MVNKIFFGLSVLIFSFSGINLTKASLGCNCWKTRDSSFQTVPFSIGSSGIPASPPDYRNDDGSSPAINLPFNFCFYGKPVNTVYINNNGNISIGAPNGVFDSRPFPDSINAMIAPFWADIDTRGLMSGIVYYSLSPTHLIVQWDHVSYYNLSASPDSLFNTFQLIITNGLDPIIPIGENVSFCYQDMQWTTGEQSGGLHGFPFLPNAFPATVGVNQGTNSMSFIQLGTFDKPGTSYDGGFGLSDGIDWLDNQSFNINACVASSNIPPILNSLNLCDTIRLCENTTQFLTANYISPEPSETTTINFSAGGIPGLSILSNTPGNSATLVIEISGMASNLGFHTLSVTATDDGLPSATTISNFVIEILPAPIPGFSFLPASPVKANNTVVFTNTAPSGSLLTWDFGDGSPLTTVPNPQHVYINTGSFSVSLSSLSPNGCFSSVTQQIVVSQCISATFSIDSACISKPVVITYSGSAPPSAVFNWSFSGGDIISGSGIGPYIISWDSAGAYSVSLNVMDSICSSTTNVLLNVYPSPEVSLVILNQTPLCEGQPVSINSVVNAGGGASFNWIFGSATVISGSGYGPYSVQWNIGGTDPVSLSVTENGCSTQSTINVTVNDIPTADFISDNSDCAGVPVNLTYTGTANANANFNWSFNGGSVISGSGIGPYSVVWNTAGTFLVSLSVDDNGCASPQKDLQKIINSLPVVHAGNDQLACSGIPVSIGNPSLAGEIYQWIPNVNLSDNAISNPTATLINNSTSIVFNDYILKAEDTNGCVNFDTIRLITKPAPIINFNTPPGQCLTNNNFTFSAVSNFISGVNYSWTFSPEANIVSSPLSEARVSYSAAGKFSVALEAEYNGCAAQMKADSVNVYPMPSSNFIAQVTSGCEPLTVPFINLSAGNSNTYSWNFNDGEFSYAITPTHLFQHSGKYDISLKAVSNFGCESVLIFSKLIDVYDSPNGQFFPNPQVVDILEPIIEFKNNSTDAVSCFWNFGDSDTSSRWNPNHIYSDTGSYTVNLILMSSRGCSDTITGWIRVEDAFTFYVPNSFTPNGDGINDSFRGYGLSVNDFKMDIFSRWGELIYSTDNYDKPWDGRLKSGFVQNDVYVYKIALNDAHHVEHTYFGKVSLIK